MRKKVLKVIIENRSDKINNNRFAKEFSRNFIGKACLHSRSLVKYLNLSVSVEDFFKVFHTFKKSDYSSFLRICNRYIIF